MSDLQLISVGTIFLAGTLFFLSLIFINKGSSIKIIDKFFMTSSSVLFLFSIVSFLIITL
jgi:hypothetical protein